VDHTNFGPKTADEISGSLYKRPNFDYLFHPVTLVGSRRAYGALKGQLCGIDTNSTTTALKGYSLSVCSTQIAKCFFSSLTVCCDTQMWIRPNGISQVMTNILHKGSSEIERSPSIFFYPGSTRYAICSSKGKHYSNCNSVGYLGCIFGPVPRGTSISAKIHLDRCAIDNGRT